MVWGFIISLIIIGVIYLFITGINKKFNTISLVIAVVMFFSLSFETNKLINVIESRSNVNDFVSSIVGSLSEYTDYSNTNSSISQNRAHQIALVCKVTMPNFAKSFSAKHFQNKTYSEIPDVVSERINYAMSRSVWNMIGWIILTIIIGIVLIILFSEKNNRRNKTRKTLYYNRYQSRYRTRRYMD